MAGPVRIALVLSAGGLRGAAHVGVIRQLVQHGIPIDAIVGVSAGAVIGAYYAAVGLDLDELIDDAAAFRGRHLLTHSLSMHFGRPFEDRLNSGAASCPVVSGSSRRPASIDFITGAASRDRLSRPPERTSALFVHRIQWRPSPERCRAGKRLNPATLPAHSRTMRDGGARADRRVERA
jgi:Patatin-like phospholipase